MADGCKIIQLGLLSTILCVRMAAVDKQDKINNEETTNILLYWIFFPFVDRWQVYGSIDGKM